MIGHLHKVTDPVRAGHGFGTRRDEGHLIVVIIEVYFLNA